MAVSVVGFELVELYQVCIYFEVAVGAQRRTFDGGGGMTLVFQAVGSRTR